MSTEKLQMWRGLPVPWVARWTNEKPSTDKVSLRSVEGPFPEFPEVSLSGARNVGALGVLWQPDGVRRGGEPEFGQMNTHRQVACMLHKRCQVCGNRILTETFNFLMDGREKALMDRTEKRTTSTPPVCDSCLVESRSLCPAMAKNSALVVAQHFEPVGVFGAIFTRDVPGAPFELALGHPALRSLVGKQLIVELEI